MLKKDFYIKMEEICPNELSEEWDNCGIQINTDREKVERVLVALEITDDVIYEAIENDADMIVTHHPLIFGEIKKIDNFDILGRYLSLLIKKDISVYSCHTSFDIMDGGNNDYFGNLLKLKNIRMFNKTDNKFCRKGNLEKETTLVDYVDLVSRYLSIDKRFFSLTGNENRIINSIGWCTGGGSGFIADAVNEKCDLFITGDLKYHDAQMAKAMGIAVLDCGHYGTEKIFVDNMGDCLTEKTECTIIKSKIDINPFV